MHLRRRRLADLLLIALCAAAPAAAQFEKPYEVVDLAPGIFAIVWGDVLEWPYEGNNLVIVNDEDVVVVDSKRTPSLAETVIAEIRKRTGKPVRYLVNTHWHADHTYSNFVFRREFPGVEIVGHPATVAPFAEILQPAIDRALAFAETAEERLAEGIDEEGRPLDAAGREALAERWRVAHDERLPIYRRIRLVPPTMTVADELVLRRGEREIRIRFVGEGNSRGDLVVYLPRERILATGDLVVRPYPFLGLDDHPQSWVRVLDELATWDVATLVPGHGPVQRDFRYLEQVRDLLASLVAQTGRRHAAGETLEQAQAGVDLGERLRAFAGDDRELYRDLVDEWVPYAVKLAWNHLEPPAG